MRLLAGCFALVTLVFIARVTAVDADPGKTADRDQILQLERDWTQSFVTMDVAANQRIVADDYLGTETDGKRINKAKLIANTQAAVERGAFGSPTFFVGNEMFFGKEQLREVEEMVTGK